MAIEWALVFQGLSSLSAVVQAVKAVLSDSRSAGEARKLEREDIRGIADGTEAEIAANKRAMLDAAEAAASLPTLDDDMIDTIRGKIRKIKQKWSDAIDGSDDPTDWEQATDVLRSDICTILRLIKRVNGGRLPSEWAKLSTANQCA